MLIDGEWVDVVSGKMIDVVNLVIGKLIGKVVYVGIVDFDCVFVVV